MPAVELVDMRRRSAAPGGGPVVFSDELRAAIEANTRSGGQTLLFLNRRGFSGYLQCPACGTPASCPHCSVTLTLHLGRRALVCHHCGFSRSSRAPCERCGGSELQGFRAGTEQIEAALAGLFPALRVARMDRDSTGRRGAHERLLRGWHDGAIDVLVGTQMVTKGIDNPCVTLVGVLSADLSLNVPDFRAGERTFQLLGQVAGRAGRGDTPGTVLVQTLRPAHYSLRAAAAHDFAAFFAEEITNRQALGYPPFRRLINLRVEARDASAAERLARDLAARLRAHAGEGSDPDAIGPAPAPIERLRGWHRWQILVRGSRPGRLRTLVREGLDDVARQLRRGSVRLVVDVDPYSML
jgi:primosomal protein N' (replication factor Y)